MNRNKVKAQRLRRRKLHIRKKVFGSAERPRLTVTRSSKHIHCQVIDDFRGVTVASASSQAKELRAEIGAKGGNIEGAILVGALLAKRAKEAGIEKLAFDRNGYKYHGRVAALADAIRKEGIQV